MFQTGKGQVGLDHYQVSGWTGWYRFITLSMLALAVLTLLAAQQPDSDPDIIALTVAEIRRLLNAEEVEHLLPDERADRRRCTRVYRRIPPALPPATAAESRTQTARDTTRAQLPRLTPPV
ncbi:hypothetical protein ACIBPB_11735 [Micromonospora sp. NPDC049836]|uniref:hypothetical protein n=1 Tax=Micromonospora sp. NPDC049836 TaxID=3364274 RepID=UPI003788039D